MESTKYREMKYSPDQLKFIEAFYGAGRLKRGIARLILWVCRIILGKPANKTSN